MYEVMRIQPILFLIMALLVSCQQNKASVSEYQWPDGVAYEIFVQSFYDSDNDSIGDIPGLTQKLDYLHDLGIDAIWLMPIMPSPSYHKYDVMDYYDIHPNYGTMDDFKEFVNEAHERGIKVIIDLVVNHTSNQHPWFVNAAEGEGSKFREYYVWADKDSVAEQIAKKEVSFDSDNIRQWHPVNGDTTKEHYYGFFWGGMPDLNFDNPEVREEIYKIGRFWLEEIGVDGFRLDAAKHIFPDERAADNVAFWQEFKKEMESIKPDVYLVGEIWANAEATAPYAAGFTSFFNFDLAFSILQSVKRSQAVNSSIAGNGWDVGEGSSFISSLIRNRKIYKQVNPGYHDAIFLSNHDQNRVMSVLENDLDKAKAAASLLLTLPGTPYIYYGEETGMRGKKPDPRIREPFLWKEGKDDDRPLWIEPEYNTAEQLQALSLQIEDENSLFNHYKKLIKIRNEYPALMEGELKNVDLQNQSVVAFERTSTTGDILVIHNIGNNTIAVALPDKYKAAILKETLNEKAALVDQEITLPHHSSAIIAF